MDGPERVVLPKRDAEYTDWVRKYPHGFVINAFKAGGKKMCWHRADCGHIQPDGVLKFVESACIKACSLNPGKLAEWANTRPEGLHYCPHFAVCGNTILEFS
jgi:hypothetical protein